MGNSKSVNFIISANTAGLTKGLRKAQTQVSSFTKKINGLTGGFGGALGMYAIAKGVAVSVKSIADFERAMAGVNAVTQASRPQMDSLTESVLHFGRTTKFTAVQVAELAKILGKMGFSTQEIEKSTEGLVYLAQAAGVDLAEAADVGAITLRAFGLEASEMGRVADAMAVGFTKSALDIVKFRESMKFVAPAAATMGVSIEQATVYLAKLADVGIDGSIAGTSMKRIFLEVAIAMEESGQTFNETLQQFLDGGRSLTKANDLVGKRALIALNALSKMGVGIAEITELMNNNKGAAIEMGKAMEDNLIGDWTKLTSAWNGVIQEGKGLIPVLRSITQEVVQMLGGQTKVEKFWSDFESAIKNSQSLKEFQKNLKELRESREYKAIILGAEEGFWGFKSDAETSVYKKQIDDLKVLIALKKEKLEIAEEEARVDKINTILGLNKVPFIGYQYTEEERKRDIRREAAEAREYAEELQDWEDKRTEKAKKAKLDPTIQTLGASLAGEEIEIIKEVIAWHDKWSQVSKDQIAGIKGTAEMVAPDFGDNNMADYQDEQLRKRIEAANLLAESERESLRLQQMQYDLQDKMAKAEQTRANIAESASGQIADLLLEEGKNRKKLFEDIMRYNAKMIAQELIRLAIHSILAGVTGGASAAGGGITKGFGSIGNIGAGILGGALPQLAEGGIATRPTMAMIGEGGEKEAIIPLSKLDKVMKGGGGGGGPTVNIHGFVGDEIAVGKAIKEALTRHSELVG